MDIQETVKEFSVQLMQSGQKEAEYWLKKHLVHVMVDAGALEGNNGLKVSEKTREWLSQFREAGKHDWLTNDKIHKLIMGAAKLLGRELALEAEMPLTPLLEQYTLADLEKAKKEYEHYLKLMGDYDGGNLNKYHAEVSRAGLNVGRIEQSLKAAGVLEMTEQEKIDAELDRLYPDAKSKSVVKYKGKKYQIRYYPISASRSGKTVFQWGHKWRCLDKEVSPKSRTS